MAYKMTWENGDTQNFPDGMEMMTMAYDLVPMRSMANKNRPIPGLYYSNDAGMTVRVQMEA